MSEYILEPAAQVIAARRVLADGPFLAAKAMAWFWDAYLPDQEKRLPEAFVVVDENDVLRDEGEVYARKELGQ